MATDTAVEQGRRVHVVITAPLGEALVGRIAAAYPAQLDLLYRPELLPPARYPGDYHGDPAWRQSPAQAAAWRAVLGQAQVVLDFDDLLPEHPLALSPDLRWVQTTLITVACGSPKDQRQPAAMSRLRKRVG